MALYFIAARGSGQDDIPSHFIWDEFFDILLVELKLGADGKFWLRARGDTLVNLKSQAYVDDSLTPFSDLTLLQRKADIVSAFAMIFGFEISVTRLRSLLMEWVMKSQPTSSLSLSFTHGAGSRAKLASVGRYRRKTWLDRT